MQPRLGTVGQVTMMSHFQRGVKLALLLLHCCLLKNKWTIATPQNQGIVSRVMGIAPVGAGSVESVFQALFLGETLQ